MANPTTSQMTTPKLSYFFNRHIRLEWKTSRPWPHKHGDMKKQDLKEFFKTRLQSGEQQSQKAQQKRFSKDARIKGLSLNYLPKFSTSSAFQFLKTRSQRTIFFQLLCQSCSMPHRGRLTNGLLNFTHVQHDYPISQYQTLTFHKVVDKR
jgi:hypothetical protein